MSVHAIRDAVIERQRGKLFHHPLYQSLDSVAQLRVFMQHHVFAVWDFMSLVKSLQRDLTCTAVPWIPKRDSEAVRLINDIVMVEEADTCMDGDGYASHYELYLDAMQEVGADTEPIRRLIDGLAGGLPLEAALSSCRGPQPAIEFVAGTLDVAQHGDVHVRAAALLYGREALIPPMFLGIVERLHKTESRCSRFLYYMKRHIDVDEHEHAPMAEQLLDRLCGIDSLKIRQAQQAARDALDARIKLWDSILAAIAALQLCSKPSHSSDCERNFEGAMPA